MANSVTIRTTAPGAKEAAGQFKTLESAISGISPTAGKMFGALEPLTRTNSQIGGLVKNALPIAGVFAGAAAAGIALGDAAKGVGEFLGQAAAASIEEEVNIGRLDAALRANVKGWDGNRDAIEAVIKKREDLAFSDDDLRDSLVTLVTSTHDVTQALSGQSLAMNIARGRNISLSEASDLVAKVLQGNYTRAFKSAGLSLDGITDKTTALNFLMKSYAGQAEKYANTTVGQFQAVNIAVQDANENLGSHLTPTIGKFAGVAKNEMVPAINSVVDGFGNILDFIFGNQAPLPSAMDDLAQRTGVLPKLMADELIAGTPPLAAAATQSFASILAAEHKVTKESVAWGENLPADVAGAMRSAKGDIKSAMDDLTYVMTHSLERQQEISRIQGLLNGKKLADGLASSDPAIRHEAEQVRQILLDKWQTLTGESWDAGRAAGTAYGRAYLSGARRLLDRLNLDISNAGPGTGGKAAGGPVSKGTPYVVGEQGEEVFVPDTNGTIIPHNQLGRMSGGANWGGSGTTVIVQIQNMYGGPAGLDALARDLASRLKQTTRGAGWQVGRA